jgi:hypothetical protein
MEAGLRALDQRLLDTTTEETERRGGLQWFPQGGESVVGIKYSRQRGERIQDIV